MLLHRERKDVRAYLDILCRLPRDSIELVSLNEPFLSKQRALFRGIESMSEYSRSTGINDIVFVDKSARPIWVGVSEYWKIYYPDEKRPSMHFINPIHFKEEIRCCESIEELHERLGFLGTECIDLLEEARSSLVDKRSEPLLLADACMHSGKGLYLVSRVLEEAGFADIRTAVVNTTLRTSDPLAPDVFGTANVAAARCVRAASGTSLVVDDPGNIHSKTVRNVTVQNTAKQVRAEIRTLVRESVINH